MRNLGKLTIGLSLLLVSSWAAAEDTRRKWQIGGGISYWSTIDDIRSNSTTAYAPLSAAQQGALPSILFSDPRPDANELNQPTIQDGFKMDFNASFGVTRWFSLQIGGSYFNGPVGNIEFYSEDRHLPISLTPTSDAGNNPGVDCNVIQCEQMTGPSTPSSRIKNGFVPMGQLTEVPVEISGLVRFRPESPFDPYVGAGVGYIFTSLDTSKSDIGTPIIMSASTATGDNRVVTMRNFQDVQNFTNGLVVANIRSGARAIPTYPTATSVGGTPITGLAATVNSAPEVHLVGGVDYYFTDHVSLFIDGRYLWAQSKVKIRIDGQNQIYSGIRDYGCVNGAPTCRTLDGAIRDTSNVFITNATLDDVQDVILIQGGDIRFGGFSLGVGVRYTF